jgi:NADH:ubiquinone oxidoreductase subunit K
MIGAGLQAIAEIREYTELLALANETDLLRLARDTLMDSFSLEVASFLAPQNLLYEMMIGLPILLMRYRMAIKLLADAVSAGDERAVRIRSGIVRARNWIVVLVGSTLVFAAAIVALAS